jgi:hypothetical protein
MAQKRDRGALVDYAVRRINACIGRFIRADSLVEKEQAMKWAKAWAKLAGLR